MKFAGAIAHGTFSNSELVSCKDRNQGWCVRYYSATGTTEPLVKVPKFMLNVTKGVSNLRQRGCRLRSSHHLKKA